MPTARAACPTEPIASRARMKHCCVTGVQPSARWRCCGTGANARQVPASSGTEGARSEEHTSALQSLMRISYAVFCLTKKKSFYTTHMPTDRQTTHLHITHSREHSIQSNLSTNTPPAKTTHKPTSEHL